ncbi:hypothetical protein M0812_08487 [Anaeramoeba flamelloides]|uniref:Uncharacterized protein n=1 Tax=Anaeramoeba flamelloides TaxID=1746091 RepID=A0AAV7ZZS4_9EUKA|nr:hypothetical protein M0812_08487 [Anaeramoeba flamelloides]
MGNVTAHKTLSPKSWKKYLKMISKSNEMILLLGETLHFSYLNRKAAKMLKIKNRKGVKLTVALISPLRQPHLGIDSASATLMVAEKILNSKDGRFDFIWQHQTVTGELFYVQVYLTIIRVKKKTHCQSIWRRINNPNDILLKSIKSFASLNSSISKDLSKESVNSVDFLNTFNQKNQKFDLNSESTNLSEYSFGSFTDNFTDNQSLTKSANSNLTITKTNNNSNYSDNTDNESNDQNNTINTSNSNKNTKNITKSNYNEQKPYLSLIIDNIDMDEEFMNFQDNIKRAVRSTNDSTAEKKVIDEFHRFETIFNTLLQKKNSQIEKLREKTIIITRDSRTRYRKLEDHLQEKLLLSNEEINKRNNLKNENIFLKNKLKEMELLIEKQKTNHDKLFQILNEHKSGIK